MKMSGSTHPRAWTRVAVMSILACGVSAYADSREHRGAIGEDDRAALPGEIRRVDSRGESVSTGPRIDLALPTDVEFVPLAVGPDDSAGVPAVVYRSESCGKVGWFSGMPIWYEQMRLDNMGYWPGYVRPLRSYTVPVCLDVCALGNRCIGGGGSEDCNCLEQEDLPVTITTQLHDGDPCVDGLPIPGTQGQFVITEAEIPEVGGSLSCFDLTFAAEPEVIISYEVWVEMSSDHEDTWVVLGSPWYGWSGESALDDGVTCDSFSDYPLDPEGCDWMIADANDQALVTISLLPVSADAPPEQNPTPDGWSIAGNEIQLAGAGRTVWLEVRFGDWDWDDVGIFLTHWVATVDSSGYSSGLQGTLTPHRPECQIDADCEGLGSAATCTLPNECADAGLSCAECAAGGTPCTCTAGYIDEDRDDYVFKGVPSLSVVYMTTLDYRFAGARYGFGRDDPEPFPPDGLYGGTLVLDVPPDAK